MIDGRSVSGFALRVVIAIALVALALLVWRLHDILLLVFAATLVAVILHAAADTLCGVVRLPRWLALALSGLIIVGVIATAATLFGHEVAAQLSGLGEALPGAWATFANWVGEDRLQSVISTVSPDGATVASIAQTALGTITASITGLTLAVLGGVYLAADPGGYRGGALLLLPEAARTPVGGAMRDTGRALRNWLLAQLLSMLATFTVVFIGLSLIGVPSALALAIVAGLLEFIPLVGPFLGAVPALLIALTGGLELFLWTAGFFVVWQQIEGNALAPLVMRYAVRIPPAVTLFALFLFGGLFGIGGIILGGPLTVATWMMVRRLWIDEREKADV